MAETTTIARPYAQAVFKLAREAGDYRPWSDVLAAATTVARDPTMAALIESPRVDRGQMAELFIDVCGKHLDTGGKNLIRLLAANRRLGLLPELARQYEALRAEAEGTLEAELISAQPVDEAYERKIAAALKAKLGREVRLSCSTDDSLVGGAIIRAGDLVIDGSVRGRLEKLAAALA